MDCFESKDFIPSVKLLIMIIFWLGNTVNIGIINLQPLAGAVNTIISIHCSFTPALFSLVEMNPDPHSAWFIEACVMAPLMHTKLSGPRPC